MGSHFCCLFTKAVGRCGCGRGPCVISKSDGIGFELPVACADATFKEVYSFEILGNFLLDRRWPWHRVAQFVELCLVMKFEL